MDYQDDAQAQAAAPQADDAAGQAPVAPVADDSVATDAPEEKPAEISEDSSEAPFEAVPERAEETSAVDQADAAPAADVSTEAPVADEPEADDQPVDTIASGSDDADADKPAGDAV